MILSHIAAAILGAAVFLLVIRIAGYLNSGRW